jgi:hypothetical protein
MFGPAGDDWGGPDWKGWWGDNPPYHAPTFILTHYPWASILMEGGTPFHFVIPPGANPAVGAVDRRS